MSGYLAGTIYGVSWVGTQLQQGMVLGQKVLLPSGKECTLVQNNPAGSTLIKNVGVKLSGLYIVDALSAANQILMGVNDNANATIPAGSYFWATERGLMFPNVVTTIAAGVIVNSGGAAGSLQASTGTAAQQTNIVTMAASGAGGATACYKS